MRLCLKLWSVKDDHGNVVRLKPAATLWLCHQLWSIPRHIEMSAFITATGVSIHFVCICDYNSGLIAQVNGCWCRTFVVTIVSRKRVLGRSTFQVCQRREWALFQLFPHLTTKERPRHILQQLKANNWTQNNVSGITSGFEVESWQHTALWTGC